MEPINANRLAELGACEPEIDRFLEIFGDDDAPLTVETAVKYAADFNWNWAAENLLTPSLWRTYQEAEIPLWRIYLETNATPWHALQEVRAYLFASLYITGKLPPADSLPEPFQKMNMGTAA